MLCKLRGCKCQYLSYENCRYLVYSSAFFLLPVIFYYYVQPSLYGRVPTSDAIFTTHHLIHLPCFSNNSQIECFRHIMRFVIPVVFYEITNVEFVYLSNTTVLNIVVLEEYTHSTLVFSTHAPHHLNPASGVAIQQALLYCE